MGKSDLHADTSRKGLHDVGYCAGLKIAMGLREDSDPKSIGISIEQTQDISGISRLMREVTLSSKIMSPNVIKKNYFA